VDSIDEKLITILQKNARLSLKQIAEMVYLSSPAVSARIDALEKQGVLTGYMATVDNLKLGFHITAFINLEMTPKQKPTFYPFIQQCPNVLECNCVTGMYSMLIKTAFRSTVELDGFIGQLQKFGNTSTQIVFSTSVQPRGVTVTEEDLLTEGK
jgi:Lrp/AsnC family transcriptional regulator, leucine-responsive regulatory protein